MIQQVLTESLLLAAIGGAPKCALELAKKRRRPRLRVRRDGAGSDRVFLVRT